MSEPSEGAMSETKAGSVLDQAIEAMESMIANLDSVLERFYIIDPDRRMATYRAALRSLREARERAVEVGIEAGEWIDLRTPENGTAIITRAVMDEHDDIPALLLSLTPTSEPKL